MNINKPILALTTGAICISFSGVFVKTSEVPSTVSAFYRVLFGSLFIVIACFYHREFKLKSWRKNRLAWLVHRDGSNLSECFSQNRPNGDAPGFGSSLQPIEVGTYNMPDSCR